jgi:hypothetical protein
MKNSPSLDEVPATLGSVTEINSAMTIANRANLSVKEAEDLDKREMFIQDQLGSVWFDSALG